MITKLQEWGYRPKPPVDEQIEEYSRWPIERRLKWLYLVNKMRRGLPEKTLKIQELFRQGKI